MSHITWSRRIAFFFHSTVSTVALSLTPYIVSFKVILMYWLLFTGCIRHWCGWTTVDHRVRLWHLTQDPAATPRDCTKELWPATGQNCQVSCYCYIIVLKPYRVTVMFWIICDNLILTYKCFCFRELNLRAPIYQKTSTYGHFGREGFPWENPKPLVVEWLATWALDHCKYFHQYVINT